MGDVSESIIEAIGSAEEALDAVMATGAGIFNARVQWLEGQLRNIVAHLELLLANLDAGLSFSDMGFGVGDEFQEMIDDLMVEIANLKDLIQMTKMVGIRR